MWWEGYCHGVEDWLPYMSLKADTESTASESENSSFGLGFGVGASIVAAAWATYAYFKKDKIHDDYTRM